MMRQFTTPSEKVTETVPVALNTKLQENFFFLFRFGLYQVL
jgi:hypothetical protein